MSTLPSTTTAAAEPSSADKAAQDDYEDTVNAAEADGVITQDEASDIESGWNNLYGGEDTKNNSDNDASASRTRGRRRGGGRGGTRSR